MTQVNNFQKDNNMDSSVKFDIDYKEDATSWSNIVDHFEKEEGFNPPLHDDYTSKFESDRFEEEESESEGEEESYKSKSPMAETWSRYVSSNKNNKDLDTLYGAVLRFLKQEKLHHAIGWLSNNFPRLERSDQERMFSQICNVGTTMSYLSDVNDITGYIIGVCDTKSLVLVQETNRLKKYQEKMFDDFKEMNKKMEALLTTYAEGANTFKAGLEKFGNMNQKIHLVLERDEPSVKKLKPLQTSTSKVAYSSFKYGGYVLICVDQDYTVSISFSESKNKLPEHLHKWITYCNGLSKVSQRRNLYKMDLVVLKAMMVKHPSLMEMSYKEIRQLYEEGRYTILELSPLSLTYV